MRPPTTAITAALVLLLPGCQREPPHRDFLLDSPQVLMVTPDPMVVEARVDGQPVSYLGMVPDRSYPHLLLPAFPQLVLASSGLPPTRRVVSASCTVNSQGFRGPVRPHAKPSPQVYRVGILGTGVTFGLGVEEDETFAALLEQRLRAHPPVDRDFQVLNFGIPCMTTDQAEPAFRHLDATWQIDTWVVALGVNDALPMFHRSVQDYQADTASLVQALAASSADTLVLVEPINTFYPWLQRYPPYRQALVDTVADRLPLLDASALLDCHERQDGLRLEVDGPHQRMVQYRHGRPTVLTRAEWSPGADQPWMAPAFYTWFEEHFVYLSTFITDVHLNPHGHRVMADLLYDQLSARLRGKRPPVPDTTGCGVF